MEKISLKNLGAILKEKKMSQDALAKKVGCGQPFISKVVRGEEVGTLTFAHKVANALGVKLEKLTGKPDLATPLLPRDIRVVWEPARFPGKESLSHLEGNFLPVPIYNVNVAGGSPEDIAREEIEGVALIHRSAIQRKTTRGLVCTYVVGDSMIPILRDGAIVCIDTTIRPERGKVLRGSVWAVKKEEGVVVKYLQISDGVIALMSANSAYPPEMITNAEAIVGRVIWVWQAI